MHKVDSIVSILLLDRSTSYGLSGPSALLLCKEGLEAREPCGLFPMTSASSVSLAEGRSTVTLR